MWINKFKIAIIEKNTGVIDRLLDETPNFSDTKEMHEAIYLLREATELLYTLRDETASTMVQLKKNMDFLRSTDIPTSNRLDIKL